MRVLEKDDIHHPRWTTKQKIISKDHCIQHATTGAFLTQTVVVEYDQE